MITNPDESRKAARLVNSEWADSLGVKIFDLRRDLADRKSTRLNSSHSQQSRMPSSA